MSKRFLWVPAGAALLCMPTLLSVPHAVAQTTPAPAAGVALPPPQPPQPVPLPAAKGIAVPEIVVEQAKPVATTVKAQPVKPKVVADEPAPKAKTVVSKPAPKTVVVEAPAPAGLPPVIDVDPTRPVIAPTVATPNFAAPISGQTVNSSDRETTKERPVFRVGDILNEVPGVSVKQGNGPRDIGVSIRGSNARNGFGIRNIVVFEDGFPVTQPDGLSRTDVTDPHAYAGADVFRGPGSSLFGNYATGGAINFRTRPGADINGVEYGIDVGSFGYLNNYLTGGAKVGNAEFSIFASDVRGDGYMGNGDYNTQTVNALLTLKPTAQDTIILKVIDNQLETHLPIRQSLAQYFANPFQKGCETAASAAAGCGTISVFNNGFNSLGGTKTLTASQAGLGRNDTRTILVARWEHSFDPLTIWRTQLVWDDRDISQPTGTTSAIGDYVSWNLMTDLTKRTELFGLEATHFVGVHYNVLPNDGKTYNVVAGGNAALGRMTAEAKGITSNFGFNLREELKLDRNWLFAAGIAIEQTHINAINTAYTYTGALGTTTTAQVGADRDFYNTAPEASLTYRPDESLQLRGRVSTGYGTPQLSNLFVTPNGTDGNNTNLKPQTNLGYDLGMVWAPSRQFKLDVTGFYEFFEDELVSQSPGAGLKSFTFNAPASEHRGVEVAAKFMPVTGVTLTAAYLYDDQYYTQYTEQLSAGAKSAKFDRSGNKIPGVAPNELTARLAYDQPAGPLKGFGTFVEYQWRDASFMDNANLLSAGASEAVNVNVHYNTQFASGWVRELTAYFEVHNILDRHNIASANNISDSISSVTGAQNGTSTLISSTGSIYAAEPRAYYGGVKLKF